MTSSERPTQRLHPFTVVSRGIENLVRYVPTIAVVLFLGTSDLFGGLEWVFWSIAGAAITLELIGSYLFTRFDIIDDRFVLHTGLLFRRNRVVPLERIQDVQISQAPVDRLLGMAALSVETAGSKHTEIRLAVIPVDEAHALRARLVQRETPTEPEAEASPSILDVGVGELVLLGVTGNYAFVALAGFLSLVMSATESSEGQRIGLPIRLIGDALPSSLGPFAPIVATAVFCVLLLVAGWLVGIGVEVARFGGFRLSRTLQHLEARFGYVTKQVVGIPARRIQLVRVEATLGQRWLGRVSVRAETAGAAGGARRAETTTLAPILRRDEVSDLLRAVGSTQDWDALDWRPASHRSLLRGLVRAAALAIAVGVGAGLIAAGQFRLVVSLGLTWGVAGTAFVLGTIHAFLRYRSLGHAEMGEFVFARSGVVTRRIWIIPRARIQFLDVRASLPERRLGIATLRVETAGAVATSAGRIIDVERPVAVQLMQRLSTDVQATGPWTEDGV